MANVYETELFFSLPDASMHPGGLRLTARAARLAGLAPGMTVADIGCGAGATAAYLQEAFGARVTGLDVSEKLIARGRLAHPGVRFLRWNGPALPFEDASLDAAFCECAFSLIGKPEALSREVFRTLRPGGVFVLSEVCRAPGVPHKGLFTEEALAGLLEGAGFAIAHREDQTQALRTFAAQLRALGSPEALGALLCGCLHTDEEAPSPRLRDLTYLLLIARKPQ